MIYLTGVGFRRVDASDWRLYPMVEMKDKKNIIGYVHSTESFGAVDGPGIRFIVFLQGCNMRCKYCHNPETWAVPEGENSLEHLRSCGIRVEIKTPEEILTQALRYKPYWKNGGGITVSGGEALLQIDFVLELFELAKKDNIHTCIDTSGITYKPDNKAYNEKLDKLMTLTDLVMLDIKHIDPIKHKELTDQPNDGILAFAKYLDEKNVPVWIRHVVVPGITDDDFYLDKLGYFIGGLKNLKALDVLPYHDLAKPKYENLGIDYKLKDVPPMDKQTAIEKKKVILQGIKRRRAEENIETDYKEHHTC